MSNLTLIAGVALVLFSSGCTSTGSRKCSSGIIYTFSPGVVHATRVECSK